MVDQPECYSSLAAILELSRALRGVDNGARIELVTANSSEIASEIKTFCETTGHVLVEHTIEPERIHFVIEKGEPREGEPERFVVICSSAKADSLIRSLETALMFRLTGHDSHLVLSGQAVVVLETDFDVVRDGGGRLFGKLALAEEAKRGYLMPEQLLVECEREGIVIHADGPSFDRFVGKNRDRIVVRARFIGPVGLTKLLVGANVVSG
jgi:TusA-related sulfurtransferase